MINKSLKLPDVINETTVIDVESHLKQETPYFTTPTVQQEPTRNKNLLHSYKEYKREVGLETYKKLNRIKVYLIVKSAKIDGIKELVLVPINNFDDLSNSAYGRALSSRAGTFQMKTEQDLNHEGLAEGMPGNRPFILEQVIKCEEPYETVSEFPLEDLVLEDEEDIDHLSSEEQELLAMSKVRFRMISVNNKLFYYYLTEHEYEQTFIDNTIFTNATLYSTDPRDINNFNADFKNRLMNLRPGQFWNKEQKRFKMPELEDLLYKNTDELISKNVIPVFCNLEGAQDLLITIFEETLEPFRKYAPIYRSSDSVNFNYTNLDYLEDSFSFKNKQATSSGKLDTLVGWLVKHRLIKPTTHRRSHFTDYPGYFENEDFEEYGDTDAFDFKSSWEFEEQSNILNYIFKDDKRDMIEFDELLLNMIDRTEVVCMGLADFLGFWNSNEIKNGELLFMPDSETVKTSWLPFLRQKRTDRFYDYHQKLQNRKRENKEYYTYEIKRQPDTRL